MTMTFMNDLWLKNIWEKFQRAQQQNSTTDDFLRLGFSLRCAASWFDSHVINVRVSWIASVKTSVAFVVRRKTIRIWSKSPRISPDSMLVPVQSRQSNMVYFIPIPCHPSWAQSHVPTGTWESRRHACSVLHRRYNGLCTHASWLPVQCLKREAIELL